jgi:uncharacterized coiled-coil protein SlyX
MPRHEKPARLITRLTEATRDKDVEIARLQAALLDAQKTAALHLARQGERDLEQARCARERDHLEGRLRELDALNASVAATLDGLEAALAEQRQRAAEACAEAAGLRAERDALAVRLVDLEPELRVLEDKKTALTRILDGVRDRMRRRELEEERAILNRKAIASVAPARNLR